jgi:hypothetical protein
VLDLIALKVMLDPSLTEAKRQAKLTSLCDNECPSCGAKGPHEDNDEVGEYLTYCCNTCGAQFANPKSSPTPNQAREGPMKLLTLNEKKLATFKDQVLLVLADYRAMEKQFLANEGTRIEIANRIIDNLKAVAK